MDELTARQAEVLQLIADFLQGTGFPPTRAEIAQQLGFRSANAAEEHLRALERKGYIEMLPGASRGIRLRNTYNVGLPVVGRVAAGSPILAEQHVQGRYQIDPSLFKPRADYLLKVRGMSMRDAGILDGDLLAVHHTGEARSGQIVVARLEGRGHRQALQAPGQPGAAAAREPRFRPHPGRHQARSAGDRGHRGGHHPQRQDVVGARRCGCEVRQPGFMLTGEPFRLTG